MRFVSGVRASVYHERLLSTECLAADGTAIRPFTCMDPHVNREGVRARERLPAGLTDVRTGARVGSHVDAHVT